MVINHLRPSWDDSPSTPVFQIPCEDRCFGPPENLLRRAGPLGVQTHISKPKAFGSYWKTTRWAPTIVINGVTTYSSYKWPYKWQTKVYNAIYRSYNPIYNDRRGPPCIQKRPNLPTIFVQDKF